MQPFQCDLQPQLQEPHRTTHTGTTTRCKTHRRNNSPQKRPQPHPPHRRGTFHRRLQPLYTEKHKVSCSSFPSSSTGLTKKLTGATEVEWVNTSWKNWDEKKEMKGKWKNGAKIWETRAQKFWKDDGSLLPLLQAKLVFESCGGILLKPGNFRHPARPGSACSCSEHEQFPQEHKKGFPADFPQGIPTRKMNARSCKKAYQRIQQDLKSLTRNCARTSETKLREAVQEHARIF